MASATVSRVRSTKTSRKSSASKITYVVVEGHAFGFEPENASDVPDDHELQECIVLGEFGDLDEAIAVCRKTNELFMKICLDQWCMVVVKF